MQSNWADKLARFARDCEHASADNASQMVKRLVDLLAEGPQSSLLDGTDTAELFRQCNADCADAAALALVRNCGMMLSRGPEGVAIASIVLPGHEREFTASSRSVALALSEALAGAVAEISPIAVEARSALPPRHRP